MAYTINKTDGSLLAVIADGTLDTSTTSLTLIGKNSESYGVALNENYVHLLENHAKDTAPSSPMVGQLWFDTISGSMQIWDGTVFKNLGTATPSATEPTPAESAIGDIWFNSTTEQTYVYNGTTYVLIGQTTPADIPAGPSDPVVAIVPEGVTDHVVVFYYVDGVVVGLTSTDAEFTPDPPLTGFNSIKPGYNLSTAVANTEFAGTATNATLFDTLTSSQFLRSDTSDTTSGSLSISNDSGLTVGVDFDLAIQVAGDTTYIVLNETDGNLIFRARPGGTFTDVITIDGFRARAEVAAPQNGLDIVNKDYVSANFAGLNGANITGHYTHTDATEIQLGNANDFHMQVTGGSLFATNDTSDMFFSATNGNVRLTGGATNGTVELWGGTGGNICVNAGQGDDRVTLYWGGSSKLNTVLDGISVTGNVTVSNTTPGSDFHLASKGYVDTVAGEMIGVDLPTAVGVTLNTNTGIAWTTRFVATGAKFAMVVADGEAIFDANSGNSRIHVYARKKGLSGNMQVGWEVLQVGADDGATDAVNIGSGSSIVECDAAGNIEVNGYKGGSTTAPAATIKIVAYWL